MAIFRSPAQVVFFACAIALGAVAADPNTSTRDSAQAMDNSVKPGDDFYHYANGGWLKTAVPAGARTFDTRAILTARTSQRVRDLIQEAAAVQSAKGSVRQKVGDYYASFMDGSSIEAKGMAPLNDELAKISAITSKASLSAYLGGTLDSEVDGLTGNADHIFGVWVNQSFTDSEHWLSRRGGVRRRAKTRFAGRSRPTLIHPENIEAILCAMSRHGIRPTTWSQRTSYI